MAIELHATQGGKPKTLGADKGYDDGDFLNALEDLGIETHIPLKVEECFGWLKVVVGLDRSQLASR